jgi:S-adenosylmethionine decarboxylase
MTTARSSQGRHLLAELFGCERALLDDRDFLARALRRAAEAARAKIVAEVWHPFTPHGVTGVIVIEESHLSIHTWPESGYAAVDFYSCGQGHLKDAISLLGRELHAERVDIIAVTRGGTPESALGVGPRERL